MEQIPRDCLNLQKKNVTRAKTKFYDTDLPTILLEKPMHFWKLINPSPLPLLTLSADERSKLSDQQSADSLNSFFASVFTKEDNRSLPRMTVATHPPIKAITIDVRGVLKAIENLDLSSSAGNDQMNSKILKKHQRFICIISTPYF